MNVLSLTEKYTVQPIKTEQTKEWLLRKHYARRMCSISFAFGLFDKDGVLGGVCTFGSPPSRSLCVGICGEENAHKVYELNRFVINGNEKNVASFFISRCLKMIGGGLIIVSYADTSKNHHGYIYQATNWIYTGLSAKRTERYDINNPNRHSKSVTEKGDIDYQSLAVRDRPQKHRYVYFTGSKTEKKNLMKSLRYTPIKEYPKGDNVNYDATHNPETQINLF